MNQAICANNSLFAPNLAGKQPPPNQRFGSGFEPVITLTFDKLTLSDS